MSLKNFHYFAWKNIPGKISQIAGSRKYTILNRSFFAKSYPPYPLYPAYTLQYRHFCMQRSSFVVCRQHSLFYVVKVFDIRLSGYKPGKGPQNSRILIEEHSQSDIFFTCTASNLNPETFFPSLCTNGVNFVVA